MTAHDAPAINHDLIEALRADLTAATWTVDALNELLTDRALAALGREQTIPSLIELEGRRDAASILTRLFMLGSTEPAASIDAALGRLGTDGAQSLGLIAPVQASDSRNEQFRALIDLRPYGAIIENTDPHAAPGVRGEVKWWIASDIPASRMTGPLRTDHVLGVGGASRSLLTMTIREHVDCALDMGCGCGIQAMHLSTHAERVVATDLSARACAFTRFNATLNDLDIQVREGSLFEPVAGETFNLIVTNPPFVITPDSLRDTKGLLEYRDGGMSRDDLVREVIRSSVKHLVPGGILQLLGNWEIPEDRDPHTGWQSRLEEWFDALPVDAWIVQRDVIDPARYIEMWLEDADPRQFINSENAGRASAYRAWLADFDAAGVGTIGMGFMAIRRHEGKESTPVHHYELALTGARPRGADVAAALRSLRLPKDLKPLRLERGEDVTEERHYVPGSPDPVLLIMHQGSGLGRSLQVGSATSALVGACDGELTLGQIVTAIGVLTERSAEDVFAEIDEPVRELLRARMLRISNSEPAE